MSASPFLPTATRVTGILKIVLREKRILQYIDHPNVVKLLDVHHTDATLYLVLELAGSGCLC